MKKENGNDDEIASLVTYSAHEVEPMLARLASLHPRAKYLAALQAVIDSGARFKYTSELETALLAHLGHPATPDTTPTRDANLRRRRRESGRACPACYDSGWVMVDDDDLTARRCECSTPVTHERVRWHDDDPPAWADEDTVADAIRAARDALHPEVDP